MNKTKACLHKGRDHIRGKDKIITNEKSWDNQPVSSRWPVSFLEEIWIFLVAGTKTNASGAWYNEVEWHLNTLHFGKVIIKKPWVSHFICKTLHKVFWPTGSFVFNTSLNGAYNPNPWRPCVHWTMSSTREKIPSHLFLYIQHPTGDMIQ